MTAGNDPLIGASLGSYEIIEAIGEGGMARIYRGYHAELNRDAAIKVINWGLQEDPEVTERFRREAQAIAKLRHPNIVQIFDFGKHTSGYFMAMEFIDGDDLAVTMRECRARQTLLPKDKIIRIIRDVAAALDYAHSQGVIHRDVKPSNIMINQEGQSILTDFGLVMLPAHASQATLGNTFGTPHYVAPEQAISSAAAVAASDLYSLGIILFELTTGQLPFDDDSPLSVALKHVSDLPPPPTRVNPELARGVEDVILRVLAKDPGDRFTTAGEMAAALQAAWGNGLGSGVSGHDSLSPPMLPPNVPPSGEVPNMTLPNSAAAPPVVERVESGAAKQQLWQKRNSNSWLGVITVGLIGVVFGALIAFLYGGYSGSFNGFGSISLPTESNAAVAIQPTDTPTSTATLTSTPTDTSLPPTATPTDTPLVLPTDTPALTPTSTETPTTTPTSTSTTAPTPIPRPTFTPTPAGLSGKILFKTDRSGRTEIYQMDANGDNQLPLPREEWSTYAQLQARQSQSPDGASQIVVRGAGQYDLWWVGLETGVELRVTSTGQPEYDPAWSPVDNRIAYVSEQTGNGDIYVLNLDGSANVRLTDNTNNFDKHPTWSPDGRRIAYWSDMGFAGNRQIFVIDLQSREITSLSDNPFNDWDPVWVH